MGQTLTIKRPIASKEVTYPLNYTPLLGVELCQKHFAWGVVSVWRKVWQGWRAGEVSILGHEGCHGELVNDWFFHIDLHRKRYQKLVKQFFHVVLQTIIFKTILIL